MALKKASRASDNDFSVLRSTAIIYTSKLIYFIYLLDGKYF